MPTQVPMKSALTVLTCDENNQEGRPVGEARACLSRRGRRILRIEMEALPVHGGLCLSLDEVLILAEASQTGEETETDVAAVLH